MRGSLGAAAAAAAAAWVGGASSSRCPEERSAGAGAAPPLAGSGEEAGGGAGAGAGSASHEGSEASPPGASRPRPRAWSTERTEAEAVCAGGAVGAAVRARSPESSSSHVEASSSSPFSRNSWSRLSRSIGAGRGGRRGAASRSIGAPPRPAPPISPRAAPSALPGGERDCLPGGERRPLNARRSARCCLLGPSLGAPSSSPAGLPRPPTALLRPPGCSMTSCGGGAGAGVGSDALGGPTMSSRLLEGATSGRPIALRYSFIPSCRASAPPLAQRAASFARCAGRRRAPGTRPWPTPTSPPSR